MQSNFRLNESSLTENYNNEDRENHVHSVKDKADD
jgi:hypothetical protein